MTIYEFDRYINGQLMAEGVTIEKAKSLEAATAAAVRIASRGPNGEAPVLVLRREREPVEPQPDALAAIERAAYERGVREAAELVRVCDFRWQAEDNILALLTQEGRP